MQLLNLCILRTPGALVISPLLFQLFTHNLLLNLKRVELLNGLIRLFFFVLHREFCVQDSLLTLKELISELNFLLMNKTFSILSRPQTFLKNGLFRFSNNLSTLKVNGGLSLLFGLSMGVLNVNHCFLPHSDPCLGQFNIPHVSRLSLELLCSIPKTFPLLSNNLLSCTTSISSCAQECFLQACHLLPQLSLLRRLLLGVSPRWCIPH